VAFSADGNTALVGAPRDSGEVGAVWVFTRTGSTWTRQAKLTGGDEESGAGRFGRSVALSANGNTALIGAPNDGGRGAAWVFTRSGSTWTQQAKLTGAGESGSGWFGQSVALSADGDTALIGGYVDHSDTGAAWVFERSGSGADASWAQQGAKLTGGGEESGEGEFGQSVALSAAGDTALVGSFHDDSGDGAAWVFARSGSGPGASWAQQGAKLTGAGEAGRGYFGDAVALTPDGGTALIGGVKDDEQRGAAWVFTRSGSGAGASWAQQGEKLTGGEEESGKGEFGWSVAFSGDGDSALVGAIGDSKWAGAVWVFGSEAPTPEPSPEPPPSGSPPGGSPTPQGTQTQTSGGGSSGAIATPKQGVAAYQVAGGGVVLLAKRLPTASGRVRVKLRCTATTTCRGRLTLTLLPQARAARRSRVVTLAMRTFSISHGQAATVVLQLDRAGRSHVRASHGYLRASLAVRVVAPDPPKTHAYAVKLVPRRAGR
jgi:hypothetical protein